MSLFLLLWSAMIISLSIPTSPILGLGLAPSPSPISNLTDSLHTVVAFALNEAADALAHINLAKPSNPSLSDCSELYGLSVDHLSQSLHPGPGSTPFDVQIWLSAALTSLDNCRASMAELNDTLSHPIFIYNRASELIVKALAISAEAVGQGSREHLHSWLPDGEAPKTDKGGDEVVVAKDGSGRFRTIKEALGGYGMREGKGRFVIHVKEGTYTENIEISREMKDVELVGDGIGLTIITGDRSAKSGFSTMESATISKYSLRSIIK